VRPDFAVFSGFDEYMLDIIIMGDDGCFPSSANFAPFLAIGIYLAVKEHDGAKITELQNLLSYVPAVFSLESPFYSVVKNAVKVAGIDITTDVLPPAGPLTDEKIEKVKELLKKLGILESRQSPRIKKN
jgi:4-hydroxy-tetrahydrodipicolinate synthase